MKMFVLFASMTVISISQPVKAQTKSAKYILDNSIVENSSSQSLNAKGLAIGLMLASNAKRVVIEEATELSNSSLETRVPGYESSAVTNLVKVKLSLISDLGECHGSGIVFVGKDETVTQIVAIKTSWPYSFSWKGPSCHVPPSANGAVVFHTETLLLTYESLADQRTPLGASAVSVANDQACVNMVSNELDNLHMGTFDHSNPKLEILKTQMTSPLRGTSFSRRDTGTFVTYEEPASEAGASWFRRLDVRQTGLLGWEEEKEILFDESCHVIKVAFRPIPQAPRLFIDKKLCNQTLTADKSGLQNTIISTICKNYFSGQSDSNQ